MVVRDYYNLEKEFPKVLDELIATKKENKELKEQLEKLHKIIEDNKHK